MFHCHFCRELIGPNVRTRRVVIEKREKEYPARNYERRGVSRDDLGGVGWEIVREVNCCEECESKAREE